MSLEAKEAAVRAFFKAQWGSGTDISWPDDKFNPPNGESWVSFTMLIFDGYQASIGSPGNNRQRRTGQVVIQVFQPQGKGSTEARQLADDAVDIFVNQNVSGVIFRNVHARPVGNDGRGYYQINVVAPFYYDDLA